MEEGEIQTEEGDKHSESLGDNQRTTSFFISNLPEGVTPEDLRGDFGRCGQLSDVYVARKRDKFGKIFAFVRFIKVGDTDKMVKALNNLNLQGRKVYARVARFSKLDSRSRIEAGGCYRANVGGQTVIPRSFERSEDLVQDKRPATGGNSNKSYRDVLTGSLENTTVREPIWVQLEDEAALGPERWFGKSVVAVVKNYNRLYNLMNGLKEVKGLRMEVRYLGGFEVLLTFSSAEKMAEFISLKDVWGDWLASVCEWQGQVLVYNRLTRLKIVGVPLTLRSEENVEKIAAMYGDIVKLAEDGSMDSDLSSAYVGVSVKYGRRIDEEIKLRWRNEEFSCWISETSERWTPGYVGDAVTVIGSDASHQQSSTEEDGSETLPVESSGPGTRDVLTHVVHNAQEGSSDVNGHSSESEEPLAQGMIGTHIEESLGNPEHVLGESLSNGVASNADKANGGDEKISMDQSKDIYFFDSLAKKLKRFRRPKDGTDHKKKAHNSEPSPSSGNRPKKRSRLGEDDPFDIDRFIGIFKPAETQVREENRDTEGSSIDLNVQAGSDTDNMALHSSSPSKPSMEGGTCSSPVGDLEVNKEVEATIKLGSLLGFDLSNHVDRVRESILDEGFYVG